MPMMTMNKWMMSLDVREEYSSVIRVNVMKSFSAGFQDRQGPFLAGEDDQGNKVYKTDSVKYVTKLYHDLVNCSAGI